MDKPQIISHVERCEDYCIHDTKWIPNSARFVVVGSRPNASGIIQVYELQKKGVELIQTVNHPKAIKCGTFGASPLDQRFLATGDFDGSMDVWDLQNANSPIYSAKDHSKIINCIDGIGGHGIGKGAPEIATGSRDGLVKVWDIRQKDQPVVNIAPEDGTAPRDCWAVAFGNSYTAEERSVCSGYDNGDVKMLDLRNMKVKWETNVKNGVCSLQFDRSDIEMNKLVATTLEGNIFVYDLRTYHATEGFAGTSQKAHNSTIWLNKHLPQNRDLFMTAGGNGALCLWKYHYPEKRFKELLNYEKIGVPGSLGLLQNTTIAPQPIISFDWSSDKMGLAVCAGFDQTVRVVIVTKLNRY